jgi:hypothetical protein
MKAPSPGSVPCCGGGPQRPHHGPDTPMGRRPQPVPEPDEVCSSAGGCTAFDVVQILEKGREAIEAWLELERAGATDPGVHQGACALRRRAAASTRLKVDRAKLGQSHRGLIMIARPRPSPMTSLSSIRPAGLTLHRAMDCSQAGCLPERTAAPYRARGPMRKFANNLTISTGAGQLGCLKITVDLMPENGQRVWMRNVEPGDGPWLFSGLARDVFNGRRLDGWRTTVLYAGHAPDALFRSTMSNIEPGNSLRDSEQYKNDRLTSRVPPMSQQAGASGLALKSLDRGPQRAFYPRKRPPSQTDRGLRRHCPRRSSASSPTGWAREVCA